MKQLSNLTGLTFNNGLINKGQLKDLMYNAFLHYGVVKSSIIADRVKNLTFYYATKSGISLSIEDLRVPYKKLELMGLTSNEVLMTNQKYAVGGITGIERFQKTIDIWNNINNFLKDEVLVYFRESDPLNPLYIMAFSGARGNISQVRQLVGMRGLMADPQGQIIDLPIRSNFREGLTVTEYIISSYGARKGLVDTALRTADSGYLTRRLVDVAQDIIIREDDCGSVIGIVASEFNKSKKLDLTRFIGRILVEDVIDKQGIICGKKGEELVPKIIRKFEESEIKDFRIRSPLTCQSLRSICRNCYGWHLAYSRLVDLGEAIGIIAAQSIGEPGTQLTMRTFHTGGVFSGDLTYQVRVPYAGIIRYSEDVKAQLFRTLHGEMGFQITKDLKLTLQNSKNNFVSFTIPPSGVLLVNNNQHVYPNEIIAEIKKDSNVILEEERKDIASEESGELYYLENQISKTDTEGFYRFQNDANLIWVLSGKIHSLNNFKTFNLKVGTYLKRDHIISRSSIHNKREGLVNLLTSDINSTSVKILCHSLTIQNLVGQEKKSKDYVFKLTNNPANLEFKFVAPLNKDLKSGDTLAVLIDNTYRTETGGIVTYNLDTGATTGKKKKNLRNTFSGSFYWIPEETHRQDKGVLKVKNGDIIKPGTEIFQNVFSKTGGLVQVNNLEQQITIKPGEIFNISNLPLDKLNRNNRFIKAGEVLIPNRIIAQQLVYLDFFNLFEVSYVLVRPVKAYSIPKTKSFYFDQKLFPKLNSPDRIQIKTVKKVFYKNWEKVISSTGVDLVTTFLIIYIPKCFTGLNSQVSLVPIFAEDKKINYRIKVSLYETIKFNNFIPRNISDNLKVKLHYLVKDQQYIYPNTALAYVEILIKKPGILASVVPNRNNGKDILVLENSHLKNIRYKGDRKNLKVKVGDLIRVGTELENNLRSAYTGQVYKILLDQILIRLGKPYLMSNGTILRVANRGLVKTDDVLATLVYEKLKTTDIVQGLPKVEEILEARKLKASCLLSPCPGYAYLRPTGTIEIFTLSGEKFSVPIADRNKVCFRNGQFIDLADPLTDGVISPHNKLELSFSYWKGKYSLQEACFKSFKALQLFLVHEIQNTYLSQGVQIADKHIEVIVRQMTSKVCIEDSGTTTFLPGEIIDFQRVIAINETAQKQNETPLSYSPILLGITKASLNSDSFISAASFQETTRVLTEAAIEGKRDWLNGLKENVIIGRLIPAGTGFSYKENRQMLEREQQDIRKIFQNENK